MNGCAVRRVLWAPRPAELGDLREVSTPPTVDPLERRFGARFAHGLERRPRYVMIAGHGRGTISAVIAAQWRFCLIVKAVQSWHFWAARNRPGIVTRPRGNRMETACTRSGGGPAPRGRSSTCERTSGPISTARSGTWPRQARCALSSSARRARWRRCWPASSSPGRRSCSWTSPSQLRGAGCSSPPARGRRRWPTRPWSRPGDRGIRPVTIP